MLYDSQGHRPWRSPTGGESPEDQTPGPSTIVKPGGRGRLAKECEQGSRGHNDSGEGGSGG